MVQINIKTNVRNFDFNDLPYLISLFIQMPENQNKLSTPNKLRRCCLFVCIMKKKRRRIKIKIKIKNTVALFEKTSLSNNYS